MCGRTVCSLDRDNLRKMSNYRDKRGRRRRPEWRDAPNGKKYIPSYNMAPGAHTPVLMSSQHTGCTDESQERVIQPMLWGLVPSWHKGTISDKGFETNNCRAESMLEKQTYKVPLQKGRRCVVLAEGFYEWQRNKSVKQPYYIYFPQPDTNNPIPDTESMISSTECRTTDVNTKEFSLNHKNTLVNYGKNLESESDLKSDTMKRVLSGNKDEVSVNVDNMVNKTHRQGVDSVDEMAGLEEVPELWNDWEPDDVEPDDVEPGDVSDVQLPRLLTIAGVFDVWNPPDGGEPVYSYSVITVDSSPAMSWIHHRMPAILTDDGEVQQWLAYGDVPITKAMKLIRPVTCLQSHPVSTIVNNSRNNTPDCIKQINPSKPKPTASSNMMMSWLTRGSKSTQPGDTPPNKKLKAS